MNAEQPALELVGIKKSYGGAPALTDGSLVVAPGTIHGVVGPNGAGKSTLMRIACGEIRPDGGVIRVAGETVHFRTPNDALRHGVALMPQELTTVPELSVEENVVLGREPSSGGLLNPARRRAIAAQVLDRIAIKVPTGLRMRTLGVAQQRAVMLARALHSGARVLVLDEPTASLSRSEADSFLNVVEDLRREGLAVVYVSHRFAEVERLCDRVTVIRDAQTIGTIERSALTIHALVEAVVSKGAVDFSGGETPERGRVEDEPVLRATALAGVEMRHVNFEARPGEIVGVCGLPGSGVGELLEVLAGAKVPLSGDVEIRGERHRLASPADALAVGISYLPAERSRAGLLDLSIRFNVVASILQRIGTKGFITARRERSISKPSLTALGLEKRRDNALRTLSGGNRQKVLLTRSLLADSAIVILDDPTVGVDVNARRDIHKQLFRFAAEGRAVIVSSSEPEELAAVADRVVVLGRGAVSDELHGDRVNPDALVRAVTVEAAKPPAYAA